MKHALAQLAVGIVVLLGFLSLASLAAEGWFEAYEATGWQQIIEAGAATAWCLGLLVWTGGVGALVLAGLRAPEEEI